MPLSIAAQGLFEGIDTIPYAWTIIKVLPWLVGFYYLKVYFGGARNTSERNMHGKVVIMTGGTSGIGASVASNLAKRGAQLVLLTQHSLDDPFLQDYIFDLRAATNNQLITAEQCDLSSLYSIRLFATKWVDNAPPRRLDMIVLCGDTMTPKGAEIQVSKDGVELNYAINYLANFQLLSILSPAIRAQPPDRDVRIIFATCSSYMAGQVLDQVPKPKPAMPSPKASKKKQVVQVARNPSASYACSKISVMAFAEAFQKHLSAHVRPDKQPNNTHVFMVDPGWCRTPGMRRFLTRGSLWGLAIYLIMWPFWWLILKSSEGGAQSFLYAAMEAEFERSSETTFLKEVLIAKVYREEVRDEAVQKKLWEVSDKAVEALEKEGAVRRALAKKEEEEAKKAGGQAEGGARETQKEKQPGSRKSRKAAKD